jgi:hypothetical protein
MHLLLHVESPEDVRRAIRILHEILEVQGEITECLLEVQESFDGRDSVTMQYRRRQRGAKILKEELHLPKYLRERSQVKSISYQF